MARWVDVGKHGTVFINCLKPAKNLLLRAKNSHPAVRLAFTVTAGALVVGGIGYYIYKKIFPLKKNHHSVGTVFV